MQPGPHIPPEQLYERLVQAVVDYAIFMLDPEGRVMSWNPGAEKIKGYTAEEIIGRHFSQFYTEEDRRAGKPERGLETAAAQGRFESEGWRVRKDGSRFWALVVIDAVRDERGDLIGFAKVTRDMTERRAAQEALRQSEASFRLLVEGVTDYAIFMLDPAGIVTNWNTGASRLKGYTAEEIVGQHFSRFYTPEDVETGRPVRALETAREEGRYESEGWRVRKDGGRFWASVVIDAIRDQSGTLLGFAKITRDITERRDAQRKLEEAREQLFQAQKIEALGQLTGGLAHDFNNLLTAIISGVELALRQSDPARIKSLLESIRASAGRGGDLTRKLLAFARRQPLEPKLLDLEQLLPSAATMLRHSLRQDIALISETSDQLWPVELDPAQLELAILNLGFNARDAMPSGGSLRISARNVTLTGEIEGLVGDFVALGVSDTGMGIAPEIRDRIFEPFFTTKGFGQGTGLGLSQVFGFVKQSQGALTVTSELGTGTTMTMYLPASHAGGRSAQPEGSSVASVLVVEDDVIVGELAAELLADLGYDARVVHSATDALSALARAKPPDLVFSDVVMPGGISGVELARKIRTRFPELPILLTTGYSEKVSGLPGEFPLLPKPYAFDALAAAVRDLLGPRAAGVQHSR